MQKTLSRLPEWRIVGVLAAIALAWYLLSIFGSFLAMFSDLFIIIILSWILAFILEPLVIKLSHQGLSRIASAAVIYILIAILAIAVISLALPATVSQLSQLSTSLPAILPNNPAISSQINAFLASTLSNSVSLATSFASTVTSLFLVLILSFYFLISRSEIAKFIHTIIPDNYEEDYAFLETVINTTFASFLRVQVVLGLAIGLITLVVFAILGIHYAISTAIFSGLLAMIPVVGPLLSIIPVILASLTVSLQMMFIAVIIIVLASQLIYNILSPRLLGSALNIHPIVVLLSFLVGYRLAGIWGAIFAVPVAAVVAIVGKELIRHWQEEADK